MQAQRVTSEHVREPKPGTWSNCKAYGNQVFISGMTAHDLEGKLIGGASMYEQAKVCFAKIRHLIEAAGGAMDDVIKVTIYVTDISEREAVWRARAEYFTGDFPCSSLVEVAALAIPDLKVEVEAIAFLGSSA